MTQMELVARCREHNGPDFDKHAWKKRVILELCDAVESFVKDKEHQSTMIRDLCLRVDEYRQQIESLVRERDALQQKLDDFGDAQNQINAEKTS